MVSPLVVDVNHVIAAGYALLGYRAYLLGTRAGTPYARELNSIRHF